jgi:adenylate cyclase
MGVRVRVTAQLIDAGTGNHVWAERYNRRIDEVFAVQDEITVAVTTAILPAVTDAEQRRALRKAPESLDAWAAYMRGLWHEGRGITADHERAKQFFLHAIELDAGFASPYSALAEAYLNDGAIYGTLSLAEAAKLSADWAKRATAIDPEDADAQATIALAAMIAGNAGEARDHLRLAKANNPNSPSVLASEEFVLLFSGLTTEAEQARTACLRLDPRGPRVAGLMQHVVISHYYECDYTKAVEAARHTVARYPQYHLTYRWLAAALGQADRTEEARMALVKAIELAPQSFEFYTRRRPPWHRPEDYEHMLEGLPKAGWEG